MSTVEGPWLRVPTKITHLKVKKKYYYMRLLPRQRLDMGSFSETILGTIRGTPMSAVKGS